MHPSSLITSLLLQPLLAGMFSMCESLYQDKSESDRIQNLAFAGPLHETGSNSGMLHGYFWRAQIFWGEIHLRLPLNGNHRISLMLLQGIVKGKEYLSLIALE